MLRLILWIACGPVAMLLGLVIQRLRNPGVDLNRCWKESTDHLGTACAFGPFILILGLVTLITSIPEYQSKSIYVLRKFES